MKTTKLIAGVILISALSTSAGELPRFSADYTSKSIDTNAPLTFRKKTQKREVLNVNRSSAFASGSKEWDEAEVTGGGLFLNFGLHFPSTKFLNPYYESGDYRYKLGFDFEFGSYFRFAKIQEGKMGIGMRLTWLSLSYTSMTIDKDIYRVAQIAPFKIGPQFGLAINEKMGVDAYYQFGFNLTDEFVAYDDPTESKAIGGNYAFMGISHEVGAAFHYQVFSIGFGYRFGKLKNFLNYYDGKKLDSAFLDDERYSINNFRITLGFKF